MPVDFKVSYMEKRIEKYLKYNILILTNGQCEH